MKLRQRFVSAVASLSNNRLALSLSSPILSAESASMKASTFLPRDQCHNLFHLQAASKTSKSSIDRLNSRKNGGRMPVTKNS